MAKADGVNPDVVRQGGSKHMEMNYLNGPVKCYWCDHLLLKLREYSLYWQTLLQKIIREAT